MEKHTEESAPEAVDSDVSAAVVIDRIPTVIVDDLAYVPSIPSSQPVIGRAKTAPIPEKILNNLNTLCKVIKPNP